MFFPTDLFSCSQIYSINSTMCPFPYYVDHLLTHKANLAILPLHERGFVLHNKNKKSVLKMFGLDKYYSLLGDS